MKDSISSPLPRFVLHDMNVVNCFPFSDAIFVLCARAHIMFSWCQYQELGPFASMVSILTISRAWPICMWMPTLS